MNAKGFLLVFRVCMHYAVGMMLWELPRCFYANTNVFLLVFRVSICSCYDDMGVPKVLLSKC